MLLIYNQMSSYSLFQEKLFAFLNSLRDNLQLYFNISAVCGISGEYSHLADLIKAYEEANGQLLNLFYEPDTVLFYGKHPVDHDEIHEYVMTFLRDAEKYTEKSNKQTMEEFFDHLCKLLKTYRYPPAKAKQLIANLIFLFLGKQYLFYPQLADKFSSFEQLNGQILQSHTLSDIQALLRDFFSKYYDLALDFTVKTHYSEIVKNAISYLQNNFSDPFVSLNTAAKAICVSSSYLSRIFHKETGVSFTAYLTELRLHIAKHYLLTTKDSISVIAEKSGYNTAKYFTNLFRKVEGISPNAYRAQSVERAFKPEKADTERSSCADEKKTSFKNHLFLTVSGTFIVVMFITYVIVVGIIVPPLLQNSVQYEKELLHQTMLSVDSYLEQINSICVQCSYSQSVYDIILKNYNYEYEHVQEYISDRWEIFKGLQNYAQFSSGVHSIYLYNANGLMYYYSLCPTINSTFNGKDSIWYDDLSCTPESKRNTWITGIHEPLQEFGTTSKPVISLIRNILDLTYFTVIGQAEIQIDSDTFHQILQSSNVESLSADREMILVDQSGYVINSLSSDYQPGSFLDNELYEIARSAPNGYSGEINGKLIHTVQSDFSGWYLIGLTDKWSIFEIRSNILSSLFLIVLISIILLVIFGFVLTQKISRPINLLHQKVNALKKGNYDYHVPIQGSRELVNLSNSFDEMAQHLKDDRNKIYQMEGQKRNAEILALQTQINPHFIFNTLNTVKYLAVLQNMTNIVTVLDDFIFLMERVFKNPNILVSFHEEFARLEAFIRIQKIALFNKVDLAFDCDSQIDSMLTMGFILQPLVENSVFHGIKPKMELERTYTGHILVKGYIRENMIHLHIIDNGIGISPDKMKALLSASDKSGIGLSNVNTRIKLRFGDQYGLQIQSEPGKGCDVLLRLPVIYDDLEQDKNV